jgi:hypothetical protein
MLGFWWGTDKFTDTKKPIEPPPDNKIDWGMVRTILFSGLSGYLEVTF